MQLPDGSLQEKTKGVMQGGVISPVLSNLFLHYVFDKWMKRNHQETPWCRYADDGLVHCKTEKEAQQILVELTNRFKECGLELHSEKTKVVYCKDGKRRKEYSNIEFTFLGYSFCRKRVKNSKDKSIFVNFTPAISKSVMKSMRARIRAQRLKKRTDLELKDIAKMYNPILRGWINYYGRYTKSKMKFIADYFNERLVAWIMSKYKKFRGCKQKAYEVLRAIYEKEPHLFAHWKIRKV